MLDDIEDYLNEYPEDDFDEEAFSEAMGELDKLDEESEQEETNG